MTIRRDRNIGREASALFASTFVVVGGILTCTFVVLSSGEDSRKPLLCGILIVSGFATFYVLMRDSKQNSALRKHGILGFRSRVDDRAPVYVPRRSRASDPSQSEPNAPPTVEVIRNLKGGPNTWAPKDAPTDREKKQRKA